MDAYIYLLIRVNHYISESFLWNPNFLKKVIYSEKLHFHVFISYIELPCKIFGKKKMVTMLYNKSKLTLLTKPPSEFFFKADSIIP